MKGDMNAATRRSLRSDIPLRRDKTILWPAERRHGGSAGTLSTCRLCRQAGRRLQDEAEYIEESVVEVFEEGKYMNGC